jgi:hypothetical protein
MLALAQRGEVLPFVQALSETAQEVNRRGSPNQVEMLRKYFADEGIVSREMFDVMSTGELDLEGRVGGAREATELFVPYEHGFTVYLERIGRAVRNFTQTTMGEFGRQVLRGVTRPISEAVGSLSTWASKAPTELKVVEGAFLSLGAVALSRKVFRGIAKSLARHGVSLGGVSEGLAKVGQSTEAAAGRSAPAWRRMAAGAGRVASKVDAVNLSIRSLVKTRLGPWLARLVPRLAQLGVVVGGISEAVTYLKRFTEAGGFGDIKEVMGTQIEGFREGGIAGLLERQTEAMEAGLRARQKMFESSGLLKWVFPMFWIDKAFADQQRKMTGFYQRAEDTIVGLALTAKEEFGGLWESIVEGMGGVKRYLSETWEDLRWEWTQFVDGFGDYWNDSWIGKGVNLWMDRVVEDFKVFKDTVADLWDGLLKVMSVAWEMTPMSHLMRLSETAAEFVGGLFGGAEAVGRSHRLGQQGPEGAAVPGAWTGEAYPWQSLIESTAARHGLQPALLRALVEQESGFNAGARSDAGALGLTQVMPGTGAEMGFSVVDLMDPAKNLEAGAQYLARQMEKFGSTELALAAYNAGPGAVQGHGGIPPYAETQDYVPAVMRNLAKYSETLPSVGPAVQEGTAARVQPGEAATVVVHQDEVVSALGETNSLLSQLVKAVLTPGASPPLALDESTRLEAQEVAGATR